MTNNNSNSDTKVGMVNEEHVSTPPSLSAEQPAPPAFATAFGYGSNSKRKTKSKVQYYNHVNKQSVLDLAKVPTRKSHSYEGANNSNVPASSDVSRPHMSKQSIDQQHHQLQKPSPSSIDSHSESNSPIASSVPRFFKYPAEPPTRVLDFLYLGTVEDATDVEFLHSHHIEVIINVSEEEYWTVDKNIVVFPFKVKDLGNFDISSVFAPTRKIINRVRKLYFDALNHTKSFELLAEEEQTSSTSQSKSNAHNNSSTLSKASNKSKTGKSKNYHFHNNASNNKINSNHHHHNNNNMSSTFSPSSSHHAPCVLVHCLKGRSRSATIVLAYLIYYNGWSVAEAMRYILQRRPTIEPNLGFIESLRQLQESMSVNERSKKCSAQSILLRNVALTTSSADVVKTYLETHVGLVRDVVMQNVRSSDKAQPITNINNNNNMNGNINAEEHQVHEIQQQELKKEGSSDISEYSEAGRLDKVEIHSTDNNTTLGEHNESTLCMVFFVCMENVARARQHITTHHSSFEKLVGRFNINKPIKVILPNRLITSASEGRRGKSNEAVSPTKSTMSTSKTGINKKRLTWPAKNEKETRTPLRASKARTPLSTTPVMQLHLSLPSSSSSEKVNETQENKER